MQFNNILLGIFSISMLSGCASIGAIKCQFVEPSNFVACINGEYGTKIETKSEARPTKPAKPSSQPKNTPEKKKSEVDL
jgi:hypothetical protein